MSSIAIVTDSIACVPAEQVDNYKIKIVPSNIFFNGRV